MGQQAKNSNKRRTKAWLRASEARFPSESSIKNSGVQLLRPALDLMVASASWSFALWVIQLTPTDSRSTTRTAIMVLVGALVTCGALTRRGAYSRRPALPKTEEVWVVLTSFVYGAGAIAVFAAFTDWTVGSREIVAAVGVGVIVRALGHGILREMVTRVAPTLTHEPVIVVGAGSEAVDLCDLIEDHPETRFRLLGVVGDQKVAERFGLSTRWLGPTDSLIEVMKEHGARSAIITPTGFRAPQFDGLTRELFGAGYDVHLSTGSAQINTGRISTRSLSHLPLMVIEHWPVSRLERAVKRLIDVTLASAFLLVLSPLFLLIALAIKLDSRGPVLFPSPRFGRNVEPFRMWKFRSMHTDAEERKESLAAQNQRTGPIFKIGDDPRVTRVGKVLRETSLDELPQFFNVLTGTMSLVGPRPALPAEEQAFAGEHRARFRVRPGITGLWQVEARSNASFEAYRRLDLHYLENWSLGFDLRILLATAEQIGVTILLLPLRIVGLSQSVDGVDPPIDLTDERLPELVLELDEAKTASNP